MFRARYIATPDPTDNETCEFAGEVFPKDKWVSVSEDLAERLKTNGTFEVQDRRPATKPAGTE